MRVFQPIGFCRLLWPPNPARGVAEIYGNTGATLLGRASKLMKTKYSRSISMFGSLCEGKLKKFRLRFLCDLLFKSDNLVQKRCNFAQQTPPSFLQDSSCVGGVRTNCCQQMPIGRLSGNRRSHSTIGSSSGPFPASCPTTSRISGSPSFSRLWKAVVFSFLALPDGFAPGFCGELSLFV
jgi:hypothetical protein